MLQLTANDFDSEIYASTSPAIVMFYADWCNKCAMMKPIFDELEKKYRSQIKFCKVNVDEATALAAKYETEIIPAFLFFDNGQLEAFFSGIIDESVFTSRINKIFRIC